MKIVTCLLDCRNSALVDGVTLGERVAAAGKDHLWEDRRRRSIDTIVVHYMSAAEVEPETPYRHEAILKIFCEYGVSAHFFISRRGKIYRLVPEEKKAWHCGGSIMPPPDNRRMVNEFSIGIELAATAQSGFTKSQYSGAAHLCAVLEKKSGRAYAYTGHDQIAGERAVRLGLRSEEKKDPGGLFDWRRFFRELRRWKSRSG